MLAPLVGGLVDWLDIQEFAAEGATAAVAPRDYASLRLSD
jgi:hypothetical protein